MSAGLFIIIIFCLQTEECMTILKRLTSAEAEIVFERLTSWARLQLEDKAHISDEVRGGTMVCVYLHFKYMYPRLNFVQVDSI